MKKINIIIVAALTLGAISVFAEEYTLPGGKVVNNPKILEREPHGVSVGHDRGITFVRYADMPKEFQEKFNYNPKAAKKYEKRLKASRKARREREKKERLEASQKAAKSRKEYAKNQQKYAYTKLKRDIVKVQMRIDYLKEEIPKMESNQGKLLNKASDVSRSGGSSTSIGNNYFWRGGYYSGSNLDSSGKRRDARTRRDVVRGIGSEYNETKMSVKSMKSELQHKKLQLVQMKERLGKMESRMNKGKKSWI